MPPKGKRTTTTTAARAGGGRKKKTQDEPQVVDMDTTADGVTIETGGDGLVEDPEPTPSVEDDEDTEVKLVHRGPADFTSVVFLLKRGEQGLTQEEYLDLINKYAGDKPHILVHFLTGGNIYKGGIYPHLAFRHLCSNYEKNYVAKSWYVETPSAELEGIELAQAWADNEAKTLKQIKEMFTAANLPRERLILWTSPAVEQDQLEKKVARIEIV